MKWYANLKMARKLLLGFAIVLTIAVVIGGVGILNIQSIAANDKQMYENMTVPIQQMAQVATSFQQVRVNLRDVILMNNSVDIADLEDKIAERRQEINTQADAFEKTILSEKVQLAYEDFLKARQGFVGYMDQIVALAKENKDTEAFALLQSDECYAAEQAEQNTILNLAQLKKEAATEKSAENERLASQALILVLGVLLGGILLAALIAWYISRLVSNSVKKIGDAAAHIADGDLSAHIDLDTKDEIGDVAKECRKMTENLNEVMSSIHAASEQVSSGASQLSDSSMSLAQGASEQASSIEELTASLEQIASQTKLNAQNASDANKLAATAQENAGQGNEQMKDMLKSMEGINDSSASISKIIKVIDDIAFQTNILALNAAVEAARAGQHGKGFAVVAEEVRNLAAKSANAARETTDMIEGSIKKVEAGTKLATQTAKALERIVEDVAQAAALVKQIDTASSEQAIGLTQINQAVMQVSQVVQANSAVSEQSAAASKELSGQAEMMRVLVGKFRLKNSGETPVKPAQIAAEPASLKSEKPRREEERPARAASKAVIALSDGEFGKY